MPRAFFDSFFPVVSAQVRAFEVPDEDQARRGGGFRGIPLIAGSTMKVIELVTEKISYGWSPEELHFQHPYLTLGQIHSALAYYWDHEEELNQEIERRLEQVERSRRALKPSLLIDRLKSKGLL